MENLKKTLCIVVNGKPIPITIETNEINVLQEGLLNGKADLEWLFIENNNGNLKSYGIFPNDELTVGCNLIYIQDQPNNAKAQTDNLSTQNAFGLDSSSTLASSSQKSSLSTSTEKRGTNDTNLLSKSDENGLSSPLLNYKLLNEALLEECIIESVRARPQLWDIRDEGYKNRIIKSRLWQEVATETNIEDINVTTVKKKWDVLRSSYIRSKKNVPSGSSGSSKGYKYQQLLSFLDDTNEPRPSRGIGGIEEYPECQEDDNTTTVTNVIDTPSPPAAKKRNKNAEKIDLKRRFVECLERSQEASIEKHDDEEEIANFSKIVTKHLKTLEVLPRLQVQQDILKIIFEAIKNQNNSNQ